MEHLCRQQPFQQVLCECLYIFNRWARCADHEFDGHHDPVTKLRHDHASHTDVQHEHSKIIKIITSHEHQQRQS